MAGCQKPQDNIFKINVSLPSRLLSINVNRKRSGFSALLFMKVQVRHPHDTIVFKQQKLYISLFQFSVLSSGNAVLMVWLDLGIIKTWLCVFCCH